MLSQIVELKYYIMHQAIQIAVIKNNDKIIDRNVQTEIKRSTILNCL
jgi:hypothetical protein